MIKRILREPSLWVAAFGVIAAALGFFREQAVAATLGLSVQTDAVYTAIAVISMLPSFLSNALAVLLGPHYASEVKNNGEKAGKSTLGRLMGLGIALASVGAVLLAGGVWLLLPFLAGRNTEKLQLSFGLISLLTLAMPAMVYITSAQSALHLLGKYSKTAGTNVLAPMLATAAIWLLPSGAWAVALALLGGYGLQAFALRQMLLKEQVPVIWPASFVWLRAIVPELTHAVAGSLAMGLATAYVQAMAATSGATDMASFNFGTKFPNAMLGLAGTFLGTFLGPLFSNMAAGLPYSRARLRVYLILTTVGVVIVTPLLSIYSEEIVRLLLKRGAFSDRDVVAVAHIQMLAALQIPAYIAALVLCRLLGAYQKIALVSKTSWLYAGIVFATASFFKVHFGVGGLLLSNAVGYLAISLIAWRACYLHTKQSPLP